MPKTKLTEALLAGYVLPEHAIQAELWDTVVDDLYLRVSRRTRTWYARVYRNEGLAREVLGHWPRLSISGARDAVRRLRAGLAASPAAESAGATWESLCRQYLDRALPYLAPATQAQWRRMIEREVIPTIGETDAGDPAACRRAVRGLLDKIERRTIFTRNRVLGVVRRVYHWAGETDLLTLAPVFHGFAALPERPRERVLTDDEAGLVLAAGAQDYPEWRIYWGLLWGTGLRRGTILAARWRDIDFGDGVWTVPGDSVKGRAGQRRSTVVPLTPRMVEALRFQRAITGRWPMVLSNLRTGAGLANPQKSVARVVAMSGVKDWHVHDIRHTVSTGLAKMRVQPHVIDTILGHASGSRIRRIYQQYDYMDERRDALMLWSDRLAELQAAGSAILASTQARTSDSDHATQA
jgi:integrase